MNKKVVKIIVGVAVLVLIVGYVAFNKYKGAQASEQGVSPSQSQQVIKAVTVAVTPAMKRQFKDETHVQGNLEAKNLALVSPRVAGVIESIFVDEGERVRGGETKLFQIDSVKMAKALKMSRQDVEVSLCSLLERKANLEKVQADSYKARLDYDRYGKLLEKAVVTANDFEQYELRFKQAQAAEKHAQTSVKLAEQQVIRAEAALEIAEKNLKDTEIFAPVDGLVSQRFSEPGEMGEVGKPVFRIEDTSVIEVSAYLPSQDYNKIQLNATTMDLEVNGISVKKQIITYKSPTIDPALRTFEVKSLTHNPPDGVVPGALAEIDITFDSRESLGVPTSCVLPRTSGAIVFVVEDNIARAAAVTTGWENEGWIEILSGIEEGGRIVSMGQDQLNDGDVVDIYEGAK